MSCSTRRKQKNLKRTRNASNQIMRRDDKKREPHEAVQLLVDTGAIENSTKGCLEEYLKELEASHTSSQTSLKRIPFATARRFLLMHQQRLLALIKAIKSVLNPPKQYGSFVNNLPDTDMNEPDDNGALPTRKKTGNSRPHTVTTTNPQHQLLKNQLFNTFNSPCLKTRVRMSATRIAKAEAAAAIIVRAQRATLASVYTFAF